MSRKPATRRNKRPLTGREAAFVRHYCSHWTGKRAVIEAGYRTKYPDQYASELIRKPHIANEIAKHTLKQSEALDVSAKWVLTKLVDQYNKAAKAADPSDDKSWPAERGHALRALEKIGQHVDVNAFRQQIGLGNPDGSNFNYSALSDDELDTLERILSKAAVAGGTESREGE